MFLPMKEENQREKKKEASLLSGERRTGRRRFPESREAGARGYEKTHFGKSRAHRSGRCSSRTSSCFRCFRRKTREQGGEAGSSVAKGSGEAIQGSYSWRKPDKKTLVQKKRKATAAVSIHRREERDE